MEKQFSTHWNSSGQKRKQVKYVANAPLHLKQKMLSSHLSKDLRKKYGRRSFQLRKNDTVKIMNGKFKKKTGKVSLVDLKNCRVAIEGMQIAKKEGSKVNVYFKASNLMITDMNMDDKKRLESIKKDNLQIKTAEKKTEVKK